LQRETEAENEQLQAEVTRARGLCVAVNVHVCNHEDHRLRPVLQEQLEEKVLELFEKGDCEVRALREQAGSRQPPGSCIVAVQGGAGGGLVVVSAIPVHVY
jgi:hypothetical protein